MATFGLIPAAGKSRRMGRPKLLLPVAGKTVVEHVIAAVRAAGVADILVVVAPDADELAQLVAAAGAHVLRLAADTPDMRATCLHGLEWIEERFAPDDGDSWLLLPADLPDPRPGPAEKMTGTEGHNLAARQIQKAFDQLSDMDRALAHLYYFEQRSLAEIAAILGSTRDALKMRLARVRQRLRNLLRDCDELF